MSYNITNPNLACTKFWLDYCEDSNLSLNLIKPDIICWLTKTEFIYDKIRLTWNTCKSFFFRLSWYWYKVSTAVIDDWFSSGNLWCEAHKVSSPLQIEFSPYVREHRIELMITCLIKETKTLTTWTSSLLVI
jgi:hypothetical protein